MTVEIIGTNIDITPAIRERIEAKFKKLDKWQADITGRHAGITKRANGQHKVEAYISLAGGKLVASAEQDDLFGAIRETLQKLERQMNKQQHKSESRRASHSESPVENDIEEELDSEEV
ncbi:ribosome hibernation-promoting factor, HPF/YfiA family [Aliivibrio kagoshimensis]|jgi:ribosome-associated inhibitor A|uniref:ribosome hibernation-promoting factor, HPF/YfiA family n=1 Tax=Aliivibrio kagoshimensis TaxID=2910230 RepID=UPI003D0C1E58